MADSKETLSPQDREALEKIEARAKAATEGPWIFTDGRRVRKLRMGDDTQMCDTQYYPWCPDRSQDWEFMAASRSDIPFLLALIRRLAGGKE